MVRIDTHAVIRMVVVHNGQLVLVWFVSIFNHCEIVAVLVSIVGQASIGQVCV